jgi:hypothetical protein
VKAGSTGAALVFMVAIALPAVAQDVHTFVAVHSALLEAGVDDLERANGLVSEAWTRVASASGALVEAHRQGESLDSLRLREEQLRVLEAELHMRLSEAESARREVLVNRAAVEAARALATTERGPNDLLTGTWRLTVQPDLQGTAYLVQQGTLISGTYELSGGWSGSFRGTLVADKVRLERIDSQLGFAAIFYGGVAESGDTVVIQGRWEATQLATGMPSAGGWNATREN